MTYLTNVLQLSTFKLLTKLIFMKTCILRPREYDGPLDTPEDFEFMRAMCRFARAFQRKKEEEEDN